MNCPSAHDRNIYHFAHKRSWWVVSISGDGVVKKQLGSRLQAVPFSREPAANARYRGVEFSGGGAKPAGCDDRGPPRAGWARAGVHALWPAPRSADCFPGPGAHADMAAAVRIFGTPLHVQCEARSTEHRARPTASRGMRHVPLAGGENHHGDEAHLTVREVR
jgi:hypothetical protein